MSKEAGVIVLGFFVSVLPILGFPQSWRDILYILCGLGIACIGFLLRADHLRSEHARQAHSSEPQRATFVDNGGVHLGSSSDIVPKPEESTAGRV